MSNTLLTYQKNLKTLPRINITFCGQGGQGVILLAILYGKAAVLQGLNSVVLPKYGPESRGTPVKSDLSLSTQPIKFPLFATCDVLVSMSQTSYSQQIQYLTEYGVVIADSSMIKEFIPRPNLVTIPATQLARDQFKDRLVANLILLGFTERILNFDKQIQEIHFITAIREEIKSKYLQKNLEAFKFGQNWSEKP
jgi:Pyruvate/2-oxoacid:ferredoxin oxidoreductase gamma subunit